MPKPVLKRPLVPWKISDEAGEPVITVSIFLAYCGLAAALRHVARRNSSFVAILRIEDPEAVDCFADATRIYIKQFARDPFDFNQSAVKIVRKSSKAECVEYDVLYKAMQNSRAVLVCESDVEFDDETRLFIDFDVTIPRPTARQISAVFKRFGHPLSARDLDTIVSARWADLRFAFPPRRPLIAGLRRLRTVRPVQTVPTYEVTPGPTLHDLHGIGMAAEWGLELARDIADFLAGEIEWGDVDSGVLISGPPGTGKTLFAGALARTCNIPIVVASAAQWQSAGYLNDFLKAMRSSFSEAKSKAPSILFIDEIDSFGDRVVADHNADYKRQAINGLLELLDGFDRRTGVIVVGATNYPDDLDPAIKRAGRLDRHFAIPLPDAPDRLSIFHHHSGLDVPIEHLERFVLATKGMSGADIARLVRQARRAARRRSSAIQIDDVLGLIGPLVPLPAEFIGSAALHETGHAIVGLEVGIGELSSIRITDEIVPGSISVLGGALFIMPEFVQKTRKYFLDYITMLLGGIAAETLVLDTFADGATGGTDSDLGKATEIATLVEACYGMGTTLAVETVDVRELPRLRAQNVGLRTAVQALLAEQFERAKRILIDNRAALEEIAAELTVVRQVIGGSVKATIEKHRRPCGGVSLVKRT